MESWLKISILLCIFGVLKEFRPSEPYVTKYLTYPPMNFTLEKISSDVYPVCIYTTMISLVFIFLLTDILLHKPVILFHILSSAVVYILFIFGRSLILIQVAEVFYGLFIASEVAYFTYIYAKVNKSHYQEVSGHTKAALLLGRSLGSLVGQVLLLYNISSYYTLNYYTLTSTCLGILCVFLLPPVSKPLSLTRIEKENIKTGHDTEEIENELAFSVSTEQDNRTFMDSLTFMKDDFCEAFSNFHIAKWVFWSALASCGYYQILTYIQVLWEEITSGTEKSVTAELNGIVEAAYMLLSAAVSYVFGYLKVNWNLYGESVLCISSFISSLMLFLMSQTSEILFAYGTFILYVIIYHGMATITYSEVAKSVNEESHGLIFGFTSFLGFIFQSALMAVVNSYLSLSARTQFVIYGFYFGILGALFGIISLFKYLRRCIPSR